MSKKYKNKVCVYCGAASSTADHLFAREFFLTRHRANLPQVPACSACNKRKSDLEHYLTAILPISGRHAHALENLSLYGARRLERNARLTRELSEGYAQDPNGVTLPFDAERMLALCRMVVKGLAFIEWGIHLDQSCESDAMFLSAEGEEPVVHLFASYSGLQQVIRNVGEGTVVYRGIKFNEANATMWLVSIYGGVFGESDGLPLSRTILAVTGPTSILHKLGSIARREQTGL